MTNSKFVILALDHDYILEVYSGVIELEAIYIIRSSSTMQESKFIWSYYISEVASAALETELFKVMGLTPAASIVGIRVTGRDDDQRASSCTTANKKN